MVAYRIAYCVRLHSMYKLVLLNMSGNLLLLRHRSPLCISPFHDCQLCMFFYFVWFIWIPNYFKHAFRDKSQPSIWNQSPSELIGFAIVDSPMHIVKRWLFRSDCLVCSVLECRFQAPFGLQVCHTRMPDSVQTSIASQLEAHINSTPINLNSLYRLLKVWAGICYMGKGLVGWCLIITCYRLTVH